MLVNYLVLIIVLLFLTSAEKGTDISYPKVKILPPSKQEIEHNRVTLVCVVTNFFPDHVTVKWYINDQLENSRARTDDFATRSGQTYSITSWPRLSLKLWYSSKYSFTCSVNFFNGNYSKEFRASVQADTGESAECLSWITMRTSIRLFWIIYATNIHQICNWEYWNCAIWNIFLNISICFQVV